MGGSAALTQKVEPDIGSQARKMGKTHKMSIYRGQNHYFIWLRNQLALSGPSVGFTTFWRHDLCWSFMLAISGLKNTI